MVSQNELEFIVPSGLAECQAARVHLTELADEVRVGIEVGSKAEPGPPCEAIGTMSRVMVKLSAPLGGPAVGWGWTARWGWCRRLGSSV